MLVLVHCLLFVVSRVFVVCGLVFVVYGRGIVSLCRLMIVVWCLV